MQKFAGKFEAKQLEEKISDKLDQSNFDKKLLIVQIGKNESSKKYVGLKIRLCDKLGIKVVSKQFSEDLDLKELRENISQLFNDQEIGGGIIQLPLPKDEHSQLLDLIPASKDLDLLSGHATEGFFKGAATMSPPVVRAIDHFVNTIPDTPDFKGKDVLIIGGGELVGLPAAKYFSVIGANVFLSDTPKVQKKARDIIPQIKDSPLYTPGQKLDYNLVLLSSGIPKLVSPEDLKEGANVIDYGSSVVENKVIGDLNYDLDTSHLGLVSTSPGGMGPLVVRYLLMNLLRV